MKAARMARKDGGPAEGDKDWDEDLKSKPERRDNETKVEDGALAKKKGGKVAKNTGGSAKIARKDGGKTELKTGGAAAKHAGRSARKSGGGCDSNPFSSARAGTAPKGHSTPGMPD